MSSAWCSSSAVSSLSGMVWSRSTCFRYSGVMESAIVSPIASWKPSFAPFWKSERLLVVGALIEVVSELVVNGHEIFFADEDAHLQGAGRLCCRRPTRWRGRRLHGLAASRTATAPRNVSGNGAKPSDLKKFSPYCTMPSGSVFFCCRISVRSKPMPLEFFGATSG